VYLFEREMCHCHS